MRVGDLVFIPFIDDNLIESNRTNLIYESDLIKTEVPKFEIGDLIMGTPESNEHYVVTNELALLEVLRVGETFVEVRLKHQPYFREKVGKLFVVNSRLFRKVRTENTNFIR